MVRKDPALLVEVKFSTVSHTCVVPRRASCAAGVMGCVVSTACDRGDACSQVRTTLVCLTCLPRHWRKDAACLPETQLWKYQPSSGVTHIPTWGLIFSSNCTQPWLSGFFERPLNIFPVFLKQFPVMCYSSILEPSENWGKTRDAACLGGTTSSRPTTSDKFRR